MKVFISWSGERSRAIAELLDSWIQCVLQAVDPWMSSKDIDRGSLWFSQISDQLKDTKIGIVCLTQENKTKPWILFESGALAKGLTSARVCTLLIDLKPEDVGNPLAQFNHTEPNREGIYELVRTLNNALVENALREKVLEQVFETYWPQFESSFEEVLAEMPSVTKTPARSDDSIMAEVLNTVRSLDKRIRSIETNPNKVIQTSRARLPTSIARKKILMLLQEGLSADAIENIMRNEVPSPFLKRFIHEFEATKAEEEGEEDSES